jgi:DNA-binding CsgD family transcriptional regulator
MRDPLRHMFELQGEVRELGPCTFQSRQHVLRRTAESVGSPAGCFVVEVELPSLRACGAVTLNFDGVNRTAWQALLENGGTFHPLVAQLFGHQSKRPPGARVLVGSALNAISPKRWHDSPFYYDHVRSAGFDDSLITMHTNGLGFGFFRERRQRPFGERERRHLELVELCVGILIYPPPDRSALPFDRRLSPRENAVRRLLLDGLCDKGIAQQLGISHHTVNQRIKRIYRAFGVHSRAQLIAQYTQAQRSAVTR